LVLKHEHKKGVPIFAKKRLYSKKKKGKSKKALVPGRIKEGKNTPNEPITVDKSRKTQT